MIVSGGGFGHPVADGARSIADWIATTGRHHSNHAHRIADMAEAITEIPAVWSTFAAGELSFDQTHPSEEALGASSYGP